MLKIVIQHLLIISSVLMSIGCVSKPVNPDDMTLCTNPRPEVCTMEYNPVCGFTEDSHKTYASGCTACSDKQVAGYKPGTCEDAEKGE